MKFTVGLQLNFVVCDNLRRGCSSTDFFKQLFHNCHKSTYDVLVM